MSLGTIGRTGPEMRQIVGFGDQSTGRGAFGGEFGAHHCNQWRLYGVRVRRSQPSELRFGVVRVVGRGIVVLDGSCLLYTSDAADE